MGSFVAQSLSRVQLFVTQWTAAFQASLSFTISQSLLKLMTIGIQPSHPVTPFSCPRSFPASGSFPMSPLFVSGDQSIGASASASVLPMNSHCSFPLGWTALILQSKGLLRVSSSTTVGKQQFFSAQPSLCSKSHTVTCPLEKNIALTRRIGL